MLQAQLNPATAQMQALAVGVHEAHADLRRKSVRLMPSHYGTVKYIPAYAAAGYTITFHVITTAGEVRGYTSHSCSPQEAICWRIFGASLVAVCLRGS